MYATSPLSPDRIETDTKAQMVRALEKMAEDQLQFVLSSLVVTRTLDKKSPAEYYDIEVSVTLRKK